MQTHFLLPLEDEPAQTLALGDILSSLSYALDLTSGQVPGHTERACLIGMRLGASLGLQEDAMSSLYYALLMKDSGCSSNAARMYEIYGGDDIQAKYAANIVDWCNLVEAVKYAAAHALPESSPLARARRMLKIAGMGGIADQLMDSRCSRGAEIALSLGLGREAAECIRFLDEHWDGQGRLIICKAAKFRYWPASPASPASPKPWKCSARPSGLAPRMKCCAPAPGAGLTRRWWAPRIHSGRMMPFGLPCV